MKCAAIFAIAAGFGLPAFAAPETYVIDNNHTFPKFEYSHFGYSLQQSRFDKTSGRITLDRAARTGSADITIDTKSVNTGYDVFNGHLKSENFFDVEKFPAINYKSNGFRFEGDKLVAIDGNLTIKGITKPLTLTITAFNCMPHPMSKKDTCGANATAKVKRSDFNLAKYVPNVGDEVTLSIAVEAGKE
ncbi:MAG: YceI family protein [Betaproteobacteria bacterium]